MKFFLITMLFPISTFAANIADFSGHWEANQATYVNKKGETFLCDGIYANIQQTPTQAKFGELRYSCGGVDIVFTPPTLEIQNGNVLYKNKYNNGIVGKITDTEADLLFVVNPQNGRDRYTVKKLSATEIDFLYEAIDVDPQTGKDVEATARGHLKLTGP